MNNQNEINLPLKALCLEDSMLDAELMIELLIESGFDLQYDIATNEREFISFLKNHHYDIILSDYHLHNFTGMLALDFVNEICPETPFICISGMISEEIAVDMLKKGAVDYLMKDRIKRLPFAVKDALEKKKIKKEKEDANKAIKESEENYRMLFNANKDSISIFLINPDGSLSNFIELNKETAEIFGRSKEELISLRFSDLEVGVDNELRKKQILELQSKGSVCFETIIKDKEGNEKNLEVKAVRINYRNQPAIMNISRDITDRKKNEQALAESELRFRNILQDIKTVAVQGYAPDGTTKYWNLGSEQLYGYTAQEAIGKSLLDLIIPSEMREDVKGAMKWMAETGRPIPSSELLLQNKDGSRVSVYSNHTIVQIPGRQQELFCIDIDMSECKKAEEALRKSEALIAKMISNIGDVIVIIDKDGINRYKSPNIKNRFGWMPEELIGKSTWDKVHPDDRELGKNFIASLTTAPNTTGTTELRYLKKDGTYCLIEITIVNLLHDSDVRGFLGNYHDITERKHAEFLLKEKTNKIEAQNEELYRTNQELIKAKEHAEESDRLKSAFLANMSHEIRTPMNGILGFAQLLKEQGLSGEERQEYISIIEKSGVRMLNIINDIVDISKIEAGLMQINMNESNINEQIEYIYTFFKPEIEAKGLSFSFQTVLATKEATINTDREKLFAILTNLVKNAIKFTNEGSIELGYVPIYSPTERNNEPTELRFFVKDTGIGIPKNRREAIFERFIQADISDKMARQGAGLGLSISKSYIEMMGGKIWVETEEDKGSTFYFTIPYGAKIEVNTNSNLQSSEKSKVQIKNLKILIAEDDEVSERLISKIVGIFADKIIKVRTGLQAVIECRNNSDIDLILMDIQMPEMGGYEATRQIRQFNKEVVIIAHTAYGLSGDMEKCLEAGCNGFISKPIDNNSLKELIKRHFI